MTRNGPSGGSTSDVVTKNTLSLSDDPVAAANHITPCPKEKSSAITAKEKNLILENCYSPCELENQIGLFVDYYDNYRYKEILKTYMKLCNNAHKPFSIRE